MQTEILKCGIEPPVSKSDRIYCGVLKKWLNGGCCVKCRYSIAQDILCERCKEVLREGFYCIIKNITLPNPEPCEMWEPKPNLSRFPETRSFTFTGEIH